MGLPISVKITVQTYLMMYDKVQFYLHKLISYFNSTRDVLYYWYEQQ